ncbi:S8 family peptidase [Massilia aurea]|uniref:S8 family peptidase n=1 Tax=Massilia aurea TaxID=373040 RepID=UPI003461E8EB
MKQYSPIQVVLDARTYQDARVRQAGGGRTDFFEGDNAGFIKHRSQISSTLRAAALQLGGQEGPCVGFLKVSMRQNALAKSHRPVKSLFPSRATAVVGIDEVGELLVQVTSGAASRAADEIDATEDHVEWVKRMKPDGRVVEEAVPSQARAETSAIEGISLWGPNDKRQFSTRVAIAWAKENNLTLRYRIDLFDFTPPQDRKVLNEVKHSHPRQWFLEQLDVEVGGGYFAINDRPSDEASERIYLWLVKDSSVKVISTLQQVRSKIPRRDEIDLDLSRHEKLLKFLDKNCIVRRVGLPNTFERSAASHVHTSGPISTHTYSTPTSGPAGYPVVGIIDGGVGEIPKAWIAREAAMVPPHQLDSSHGTEIASLLIDGQSLNGPKVCPEPDGCMIVDIAALPRPIFFYDNYPGGDLGLLAALEVEVRKAKEATGVRIFCFSHNINYAVRPDTYDMLSLGLDNIARKHDVIFVISAGNLASNVVRPEWKSKSADVLSDLANAVDDRVRAPADSILNISVSALNPLTVTHVLPGVPARYSRRGPGFKFTTKPDVTHFGGCGPGDVAGPSGLLAVTTDGVVASVHGTSYSGPLAAKTLARLDLLTQGTLTREALIALLIHGTSIPDSVSAKDYLQVRRDLVGFGLPMPALNLLEGEQTSATLVFLDVLQPKKDLFFQFRWPECLSVEGKCRGEARVTLVYSPPVGEKFGAEMIRINLDVSLQQYDPEKETYGAKTKSVFKPTSDAEKSHEHELIKASMKWGNVKQVEFSSPRGVGKSSDWRLNIGYLERQDAIFPPEGVQFAVIVTLRDPKKNAPVYQDMRSTLASTNVRTEDIQVYGRAQIRGSTG